MIDIIKEHLSRYPLMESEDIIKLIYQSYFGPRHVEEQYLNIVNTINNELKFVGNVTHIEDIGHNLVRFYFSNNIDANKLAEAIINTAKKYNPDIDGFISCINEVITNHVYPLDMKLVNYIKNNGYKSIHHSNVYKMHYNPHYYVIYKDLAPDLLK